MSSSGAEVTVFPVSRRTLKRSERVSRTQLCSGWTVSTCSSLFTQARKGGALSHSLVMSHWEGFSMDWHSWSLMWPGTDATWLRRCSYASRNWFCAPSWRSSSRTTRSLEPSKAD